MEQAMEELPLILNETGMKWIYEAREHYLGNGWRCYYLLHQKVELNLIARYILTLYDTGHEKYFAVFCMKKRLNADILLLCFFSYVNWIQKVTISPWKTAWKVSKIGVLFGPYFKLNSEIYSVNAYTQSNFGKIRSRKNSEFECFSRSVNIRTKPTCWQINSKKKTLTSFTQ